MHCESSIPPVPEPCLRTLENETKFLSIAFDKMGKGRLFYDVIICKATFALENGLLVPAEKSVPIHFADQFWNEENVAQSSLKVAGDVVLFKPSTDILITGDASTHDEKPRKYWEGGLYVINKARVLAQHKMRLFGPRFWRRHFLKGWIMSDPEPARKVALRHEFAFGGGQQSNKSLQNNPVGLGYFDPRKASSSQIYEGPQIESASESISVGNHSYALAAPTPVPRHWPTRSRYAGTYDEIWRSQFDREIIPDFPSDFDYRFFQCAIPSLICSDYLYGDERISIQGMLAGKTEMTSFDLPGIGIIADLAGTKETYQSAMRLDTVEINLDERTIALTWRLPLDQREGIEQARLRTSTVTQSHQ